jgi:predicted nucleic acid-binding protein
MSPSAVLWHRTQSSNAHGEPNRPPRFDGSSELATSSNPADAPKRELAVSLLAADDLALSVQVLQEFYVQATRTTRAAALDHAVAMGLIRTWRRFKVQDVTLAVMLHALNIKASYRISYWDAAIAAAAHALGCEELLSDDLGHGQRIEGVLITNPFRLP